jgi:hypothetical protein
MYVASLVFAAVVGQSNPSDASRANLDRIFKDYKASVVVVTDNRTSQWRYMPGPIEKVLGPVLYGENQKLRRSLRASWFSPTQLYPWRWRQGR